MRRRLGATYRFGPCASWWRPRKESVGTRARSSPCTPGKSAQARQRWPQGSARIGRGARPASCAWRSSTRSTSGRSNWSGCCLREGQRASGAKEGQASGPGREGTRGRRAAGEEGVGRGGTYCRWCRWHRSGAMSPEPAGVGLRCADNSDPPLFAEPTPRGAWTLKWGNCTPSTLAPRQARPHARLTGSDSPRQRLPKACRRASDEHCSE